jgi:hypothetical protein
VKTDAIKPSLSLRRAKRWQIWLVAVGLLTFAEVAQMAGIRTDRSDRDIYGSDEFGTVITDDSGHGFAFAKEHLWELVIGNEKVPLWRWIEAR